MKKKNIFVILLIVALVLSTFTYSAYADEENAEGGGTAPEVTEPLPEPEPQPVPPAPVPVPKPVPAPVPAPAPAPAPKPAPAPAPKPDTTENGNEDEEVQNKDISTKLSDLSITAGSLHPAFSKDVHKYTVYISKPEVSILCRIDYMTESEGASVSVSGPEEILNDDIKRVVTVSDGNGNKTKYEVKVHIMQENEKIIEGHLYRINNDPDIKDLPGDFIFNQVYVGEKSYAGCASLEEDLYMIEYTGPKKKSAWFAVLPEGTKMFPAKIEEHKGKREISFSDGKKEYRYYDGSKGMGLYYINHNGKAEPVNKELMAEHKHKAEPEKSKSLKPAVAAVALIIVVAVILVAVFKKKKTKKIIETESDFEPDEITRF